VDQLSQQSTGAVAEGDFFERVVRFAKSTTSWSATMRHTPRWPSTATADEHAPGQRAKDVCLEFQSCSKAYNMTGWRIGMAVGNAEMRDALMRFKSNLDSGIPQAIQYAAIEALRGDQKCIDDHNAIYQRRRDRMLKVLREMGLASGRLRRAFICGPGSRTAIPRRTMPRRFWKPPGWW